MNPSRTSIRTSLGLTILSMGLVALLLVILTSEAYQRFALANQHDTLHERAIIKVDTILNSVANLAIEMGSEIQTHRELREAIANHDSGVLIASLNQEFHRALVTLGHMQLSKIYLIDTAFKTIAASSEGHVDFSSSALPCRDFLAQMSQRQGPDRLKPVSSLCTAHGNPYLSILTPVGGLNPQGYFLLMVNPTHNILRATDDIGAPIRLHLPSGELVGQSANWPAVPASDVIFTEYNLRTPENVAYLKVTVAGEISELLKKLSATRKLILVTGTLSTLAITLIALYLVQRIAVHPLRALGDHLRLIHEDKSNIGKQLEVTGGLEIAGITTDFNRISNELRALYNTLENMAFSDPLTNMPNRALFYNRLDHAIIETERYNTPFAIFMMDLDRFKNINDTLGHHIGDLLLQETGKRLQQVVRKSDTVARLGGDEFAIILPTIEHNESVNKAAEKIITALAAPIMVEGHSLTIGASIGIVHCPHDGTDANLLMRRADVAMYQAKKNDMGYAIYNAAMDSQSLFELTIEAEINRAMDSGYFQLHYQPKIDMRKNCLAGAEALLRWKHPEHGMIPPDQFIPLAEKSGMINKVTRWVLQQALAQCAAWHDIGIKINVAVNLSAYSLKDNSLCDMINQALEQARVAPQYLTLELTESAIMSDASAALKTLIQIDAMGVRLSVDDFGTGYSSLAYLKRLPVDEIKIDKSFVMDMMSNANDAVIVRSTIDLAHNMGMAVVAEGIENQKTLDALKQMNCDIGQGYFLSKPVPAAELQQWLAASPWNPALAAAN